MQKSCTLEKGVDMWLFLINNFLESKAQNCGNFYARKVYNCTLSALFVDKLAIPLRLGAQNDKYFKKTLDPYHKRRRKS